MIPFQSSPIVVALAATLVLALPRTSGGAGLDSVRVDACGHAACEITHTAGGSAVIEVRGRAPADARRMLDLTVYNAATYEIAYYDTAEAPRSGDFVLRIPLGALRPGRYTFTVTPRYSRVLLAAGALTAAGMVPATPAWVSQVAEEFRR